MSANAWNDLRSITVSRLGALTDETPSQLFVRKGNINIRYLDCAFPNASTLVYFDQGMKTFLEVDEQDNIAIPPHVEQYFVIFKCRDWAPQNISEATENSNDWMNVTLINSPNLNQDQDSKHEILEKPLADHLTSPNSPGIDISVLNSDANHHSLFSSALVVGSDDLSLNANNMILYKDSNAPNDLPPRSSSIIINSRTSSNHEAHHSQELALENEHLTNRDETTTNLEGKKRSMTNSEENIDCSICLQAINNASFVDICLHKFCYECLFQWSQEKNDCPLCKEKFQNIIHNVKSDTEYDLQDISIIHLE